MAAAAALPGMQAATALRRRTQRRAAERIAAKLRRNQAARSK
jgi:hypothetical protein